MQLSIIIPTCGRPRILQQTLDCIERQTVKNLEVIIVSDGPDEKTAEMLTNLSWPFAFQYFAIPKSHQGVCRNRAVEKARSPLVLIIGDDIFLAPDACERHVKAHERAEEKGIMVLGFTTWDPSIQLTPVMKWMEQSGAQFGYGKIKNFRKNFLPTSIQHWFTYTSNLSLPAKLLYQNKFREDVSLYGWEDIEWGKRLAKKGVPLFYEPDAKAYHHHSYTDEEVWRRSRLLGQSAVIMEKTDPSLTLLPRGWKRIAYHLMALFPTYRGKHSHAFLEGMRGAKINS
ncbi:MAG TPA: glycosyltransferase [Candidatus Peribacterales bacterium]|nr:glycosyltransferase [Candidatus Peribacterales bacterium]